MKNWTKLLTITFIICCIWYVFKTQNIQPITPEVIIKQVPLTDIVSTKSNQSIIEDQLANVIEELNSTNKKKETKPPFKVIVGFITLLGSSTYLCTIIYSKIKALVLIYGVWNPDPIFLITVAIILSATTLTYNVLMLYQWKWLDIESFILFSEFIESTQKADDLEFAKLHYERTKDFITWVLEGED